MSNPEPERPEEAGQTARQPKKPRPQRGAKPPPKPVDGAKPKIPTAAGAKPASRMPPGKPGATGGKPAGQKAGSRKTTKRVGHADGGTRKIGQIMVDLGFLDESQLWDILEEARTNGVRVGQVASRPRPGQRGATASGDRRTASVCGS